MMAQLTALNGPLQGAVFPLPRSGVFLLGQCLYNDIQLTDRSAAPYHCVFVRGTEIDEDPYVVIDLHTKEGTRVNEVRVNKAELHSGSEIVVGDTRLRFETQSGPNRPLPVTPDVAIALLEEQKRQQRRARKALVNSPAARARVACVRGTATDGEVSVNPSLPFYVGRTRVADVVLTDRGASRHQCLLCCDPSTVTFTLHDLATTNGTLLNGETIGAAPLHDGDVIEIGTGAQLVFREAVVERESQAPEEIGDLAEATMVIPRTKNGRIRSGRGHGRGLRPAPKFSKEDTFVRAAAAKEKHGLQPAKKRARKDKTKEAGTRDKAKKAATPDQILPIAEATRPMCLFAEAYRTLRTNLDLASVAGTGRCIAVTSAGPQEGKTCVAVNVAISAARVGMRVLLLEGDLRRSRLHRVFAVKARPGLVNYLANGAEINGHVRPTYIENLFVLPRGSRPANPTELLHSEVFADLLERLREQFDLIVIDTPPTLTVADASVLSTLTDGYLLVVRSGKTPRKAAMETVKQIERVHGKVLGVVLNDVDPKERGYGYYHYDDTY